MAARASVIKDVFDAIRTDVIPGSFSPDRKKFVFKTLMYTSEKKGLLEWTIEVCLKKGTKYVPIDDDMFHAKLDDHYTSEYIVTSQQVGGKIRDSVPTIINTGKNIGKKNETNVLCQAFKDAFSLYTKQLKRTSIRTGDNRPPPMLVQWINSSTSSTLTSEDFKKGITLQKKYNGVRYVTYYNGQVVQYSRTGAEYHPAKYLTDELTKLLTNTPSSYSNPYLDGELYMHGKSLAYISGQARREDNKEPLYYYVFDVFFPDFDSDSDSTPVKSRDRQKYLDELFSMNPGLKYIKRVENYKVTNMDQINKLTDQFIKEGYEGSIARKDELEYKYSINNYHSSNIVKIKPIFSEEFKVVGFIGGKKGKDVGKIIWVCEVNDKKDPNDTLFTVVPNMSLEDRSTLFKCLQESSLFDKHIKNKLLTLEYAELSSKTGKPLQAKAIAFRTYEDKNDPIKKIFKDCDII
jgi:ATP-dependent DNA ligase